MNIVRIDNPAELRPAHVALLGVMLLALAGNCLLTSAAKPNALPDGAVAWDPDSLLLATVELLDLQYAQPTPKGVAIKKLVHGVATGIGALIIAMGMAVALRGAGTDGAGDTIIDVERLAVGDTDDASFTKRQLDPVRTSQVLMAAFIGWSFLSALWSHAPEFAVSGSVLLLIQVGWAFVLGFGLNRRAAAGAVHMLVVVLVATAVLANAYHGERNPTLRASYPIGNPLFLAACLIPGLLAACAGAFARGSDAVRSRGRSGIPMMFVYTAAVVVMARTFESALSRGPAIGLGVGVLALVFFAGRRRTKWIAGGAAVVGLLVVGGYFLSQRSDPSLTGRSASMRTRFYAWNYALDLFQSHPIVGNGQGGYTLLADRLAADDVEADPLALDARIAHAHNEWLEVASDLGSIGLVLIGGSLLLALYGGVLALRRPAPVARRVALVVLLASLVGLIVDECTSPGLRHAGLPFVFYTVVGLVWALSSDRTRRPIVSGKLRRCLRGGAVVAAACVALTVGEAARRDFSGARSMFDSTTHLRQGEWAEATLAASRARHGLLDPHDKLLALRRQIESHQLAAAALQAKYVSRRQASEASSPPDPMLLERAEQARAESEAHLAAGYTALEELRDVAYGSIGTAWLEYGLRHIHAIYAEIDGNTQAATDLRRGAAMALERQIARQPYDPRLAAQFVIEAADRLNLSQVLDLLARPLRVSAMPASYLELLDRLATADTFVQGAAPIFEAARRTHDTDANPILWAPEKLRLAAALAFTSGYYEQASADLQRAAEMYDRMDGAAALARASCHAELADARFLASPDDPQTAIDEAELAIKCAPRSQLGRALCDRVGMRLVSYHLAAGHEDFARKIVLRTQPGLKDSQADMVIAEAYVRMAYSVFEQLAQRNPELLGSWTQRAQSLAPDTSAVWALTAELAIRQADERTLENAIRRFRHTGGSPEAISELLQRATAAFPDNKTLQAMLEDTQRTIQENAKPNQPPNAQP